MNVLLWDEPVLHARLRPLSYLRPIGTCRLGLWTLSQKWIQALGQGADYLTLPYLSALYGQPSTDASLLVNAAVLPQTALVASIRALDVGDVLYAESDATGTHKNYLLAAHLSAKGLSAFVKDYHSAKDASFDGLSGPWVKKTIAYRASSPIQTLVYPWQFFQWNAEAIEQDVSVFLQNKSQTSSRLGAGVRIYGAPSRLYVAPDVKMHEAIINTEEGSVFLGKGAVVEEGVLLRGPCVVGAQARVSAGARIKGGVTLGPHTKAGGEIHSSVFMGYSNKAHEGFMGHSVIGHWCNIGAGTEVSNLKNTYSPVKMWSYGTGTSGTYVSLADFFGGLIMGDHSKCGIHTQFNTGTVVGVCSNVVELGYTPKHIPSFTWGRASVQDKWTAYALDKACEVAKRVMARRGQPWRAEARAIFQHVFHNTAIHRG